jgi:uncharacterized membrane protein YcaP (DUF421 family)
MTRQLWDQLGMSAVEVLAVTIATTVLFWVFTYLMSHYGQQMRARATVTTFALMAVVGAVAARAMLGPNPTMAAGVVALLVLFAWEGVFRLVGRRLPAGVIPARQARVVLRDGVVDEAALRRAQVRRADLMVRLRRAGVVRLADLAYAIVEADGTITVIRAGQPCDPELLDQVAGIG